MAFIITTDIRGAILIPSIGSAGPVRRCHEAVVIRDFSATTGCSCHIRRARYVRCGALLAVASGRAFATSRVP